MPCLRAERPRSLPSLLAAALCDRRGRRAERAGRRGACRAAARSHGGATEQLAVAGASRTRRALAQVADAQQRRDDVLGGGVQHQHLVRFVIMAGLERGGRRVQVQQAHQRVCAPAARVERG